MGITDLWKILEPFRESTALQIYATQHRMRADSLGLTEPMQTTMTIGVDMGLWMAECNAGASIKKSPYSYQQTPGGGLYLFFKRLTELQKTPVFFIFVLDGPNRPQHKRGHKVIHRRIPWEKHAVKFIRAFGYTLHEAPGEAEAELSQFYIHGLVDGIITEDNDACVFGAGLILRRPTQSDAEFEGQYYAYNFRQASQTPGLPLSRGGSLLIALLCGGDYDNGVVDCGYASAFALARCGYGDTLRDAFLALSRPEFDNFVVLWRATLRMELIHNYHGYLYAKNRAAASSIMDSPFPSYDTIQKYVFPVTSWSGGYHIPTSNDWSAITPAVCEIAQLCKKHFEWNDLRELKGKFEQYVLEGLCLQLLYSPHLDHPRSPTKFSIANGLRMSVIRLGYEKRRGRYYKIYGDDPQPRLQVATADLIQLMDPDEDMSSPSDSIIVHPPEYYVRNVHHIVPTTTGSSRRTKDDQDQGKGKAKQSVLLRKLDDAFNDQTGGPSSSSSTKRAKRSKSSKRLA